jgi:hypothetical protein
MGIVLRVFLQIENNKVKEIPKDRRLIQWTPPPPEISIGILFYLFNVSRC